MNILLVSLCMYFQTSLLIKLTNHLPPWSRVLEKLIFKSLVKKISQLFWIPKFHYRVQKIRPLIHISSQTNPVHTLLHYFLNINSNIILPFTSRSSAWTLPFGFSGQSFLYFSHLSNLFSMPGLLNPPRFDHPNNVW
jgi:hypothetical protein